MNFSQGHSRTKVQCLVDVSDIFYFSCSGEESGAPGDRDGGGVGFLLKIPGGGDLPGGGGRGRGRREGVCKEFGGIGGGEG